jgi:hypothetical protein
MSGGDGAFAEATTPQVIFSAEAGALGVQNHNIKFGKSGTQVDYLRDGRQDILYPFQRFQASVATPDSRWIFLYQPLVLESRPVLKRDILVDGETFAAGTPMNLTYSFPFFRVSYLSMTAYGSGVWGWGGSLQIRNASIIFESAAGDRRTINQNIGPVPAFKGFWQHNLGATFVATEVDTMYAPVKVLNGSDSDVVGAFTDASLKYGLRSSDDSRQYFAAVRYVGGGARGTSERGPKRTDGYSSNWIDLVTFSLGVNYQLAL